MTKYTAWAKWSTCTKSCGGGVQHRGRQVISQPTNGGKACVHVHEIATCNSHKCPIDCIQTQWSTWSKCSAECDGGITTRQRKITRASKHGGVACGTTRP